MTKEDWLVIGIMLLITTPLWPMFVEAIKDWWRDLIDAFKS